MWQQWVNFMLGLWIAVSSYFISSIDGMMLNMMVFGLAIAVFAIWEAYEKHPREEQEQHRHGARHSHA